MGKFGKVMLWLVPALIGLILLIVFWHDLTLFVTRVGTTIILVVAALAAGWLLGFLNARSRYKR